MIRFIQKLFDSGGFIPQGNSYSWSPDILVYNVIGEGLTALVFFAIPVIIYFIAKKRHGASQRSLIALFIFFYIFVGFTHFLEIVTIWSPIYRLQGLFKLLTGLISLISIIALYRAIPSFIRMPGQKRLEEVNLKLRLEVAERERAQVALRQANEALESRVQQRTAQLIKINRELEKEIEQRKRTECDLTEKNAELMRMNNNLNNFA